MSAKSIPLIPVAVRSVRPQGRSVGHVLGKLAWPAAIAFVLLLTWWTVTELVQSSGSVSSEAYMSGFGGSAGFVMVPGFVPIALALVLPVFAGIALFAIAMALWSTHEME